MNNLPIQPVDMISTRINAGRTIEAQTPSDPGSFGQWLKTSIESVNQMQQAGDNAALKLVTGENNDIHGTMIAMQKASTSMSLMMEVRNKIINAYEEIKRMQF
jgi:flagellar hook-basal body complex protein FliE